MSRPFSLPIAAIVLSWFAALALPAAAQPATPSTPTSNSSPQPPSPIAPEQPPADSAPAPEFSPQLLNDQLAKLDPRRPWDYFELGEDVAAQATDAAGRALARTLFVLAYETAKTAPPSPAGTTAVDIRISVCLALATVTSDRSEQRWLRAIASSLGWNGPQSGLPQSPGTAAATDPAGLELSSAMGLIRIGEGRRAAKLLEKPEVSQLLDRSERLLSPAGLTGGAARIRRLMAEWPTCTECKNRRFTKTQDGVRLCPRCGGKPGPKLSQQELLYQLRLESTLLHGVQRSWVAQTVVDGGAPLRDLDPDELAATYGVNPARTLWRAGDWVAPPPPAAPRPDSGP